MLDCTWPYQLLPLVIYVSHSDGLVIRMSSAPLVQEDVLPLEICIHICSFVETHGLSVLALMDRMWNQAATIALYEHIDLIRPRAIWRCIKTLSRPPEALSFGRDLTIYPKSIRIRYPMLIYVVDQSRQALADILISTLPRLINIRSFSCAIPLPSIPRILLSFAAGRTSLLRTLDLMSQGDGRMVMEVNFDIDLALDVLTFSSFELTLPIGGPASTAAYASFFKRTICHSPHALRVLSLNFGSSMTAAGSPIVDVISRLPILQHLEELSIPEAFLHFPCFAQAPRLKSLTYYANADLLGSTDYSTLEVLACSSSIGVLEAFLPNVQTHRRPIHTLRLDRTRYERHGDFSVRIPMTAADTLPVLARIAYSGVPVRHLAISIPDEVLSSFGDPTIAPFLGHLESLVLVIIPLFTIHRQGMRETYEVRRCPARSLRALPRLH